MGKDYIKKKNKSPQISLKTVVQQEEFESPTSRFVAECSIQLSYCCIYRKYYKAPLQHFHLKYIFKEKFRGKATKLILNPFNINKFKIVCSIS